MKKLFLQSVLLPACVLFTTMVESGATPLVFGDWGYGVANEGNPLRPVAVITNYNGTGGNVVVPSEIEGNPVVRVGNSITSIDGYARITSIVIPDSVTSIATSSFNRCINLTNVHLGVGVTNVGYIAFARCSKLANINIPKSVSTLGEYAFWRCASLTNVAIDTNNAISNIGMATFADCPKLTSVTIPSKVTTIGDYAFNNCIRLTNVVIPDKVTSIGEFAFSYCRDLEKMVIPDSVQRIGSSAFAECLKLSHVELRDGLKEIGSAAFIYNDALRTIRIPNGVQTLADDLFYDARNLNTVIVGTGVTGIGDTAFGREIDEDPSKNIPTLTGVLFLGDMPAAIGPKNDIFSNNAPTIYRLPNTQGWSESFFNLPVRLFAPQAGGADFIETRFAFGWSGTGPIPMSVQRTTSLQQSEWTTLMTGVTNGVFLDDEPPTSRAFYRAVLP